MAESGSDASITAIGRIESMPGPERKSGVVVAPIL